MNHLNGMVYNAENRLEKVTHLNTDIVTYYQYDSSGQRVRKTTINSDADITEMRKYVGGREVFEKRDDNDDILLSRETLHVSDDTGRIVLIETQTDITPEPVLRYQYSNHLGSATLELDEDGAVISYEEYYPYGSTSFQSGRSSAEVSLKRYRYTGKERDEETGMYYHGARYYIPWLARWTAGDPINNEWYNLCKGQANKNVKRQHVELTASPYEYCYDNPVRFTDMSGEQPAFDKIMNLIKEAVGINNINNPPNPTTTEGRGRLAIQEKTQQALKSTERLSDPGGRLAAQMDLSAGDKNIVAGTFNVVAGLSEVFIGAATVEVNPGVAAGTMMLGLTTISLGITQITEGIVNNSEPKVSDAGSIASFITETYNKNTPNPNPQAEAIAGIADFVLGYVLPRAATGESATKIVDDLVDLFSKDPKLYEKINTVSDVQDIREFFMNMYEASKSAGQESQNNQTSQSNDSTKNQHIYNGRDNVELNNR